MYGDTAMPYGGRPNARTTRYILESCKTPEDVYYGFKWKYSVWEGFIWRSPKKSGSWERIAPVVPNRYGRGDRTIGSKSTTTGK